MKFNSHEVDFFPNVQGLSSPDSEYVPKQRSPQTDTYELYANLHTHTSTVL